MKGYAHPVSQNTVVLRRLRAEHGRDGFTRYLPLGTEVVGEIEKAVKDVFDALGGASLIKSSGEVYIKPNGVGQQPYAFTRPEVLEAAIRYWQSAGAKRVYVLENSTQGALTRTVFEFTGYGEVCKRTRAQPVYLDEERTVPCLFSGKGPAGEGTPDGYHRTSFGMPAVVAEKLIEEKERNLYVNIPKLKTHPMAVVTLGIKNQWGLVPHGDRIADHNYNLHSKLVDVLAHVRPDVTLIEGVEGTIYGHYPPLALADKCVRPFRVLIGGLNVVAVDAVGAKVFGMGIEDVPHIKLAIERGLGGGVGTLDDVSLAGDFDDVQRIDLLDELADFGGRYPHALYPAFPTDVAVVTGKEMACNDGCLGGALSGIQLLYLDSGGKGGWTLVAGKGFDAREIDGLDGPVMVAGGCAVEEVGDRLAKRLGRKKVYLVDGCCDLTGTTEALCHLMRVDAVRVGSSPRRIGLLKAFEILLRARLNRSSGRQVSVFSKAFKKR
ncbi:MAG: DUF362 domain-containing protein [Dehalococcoidia bacterium]|nr:DUF362 domain-containing protein [Dehalococcoidia bacterium]